MNHPCPAVMNKLINLMNKKKVVTAAVVFEDKIISLSFNDVKESGNPTNHAEIIAIEKASKILGTHKLYGCWLYSTFEPCPMCSSAAVWARMEGIVCGANMEDKSEVYTQRIAIRCREIIENGDFNLKMFPDFMRRECLEAMG